MGDFKHSFSGFSPEDIKEDQEQKTLDVPKVEKTTEQPKSAFSPSGTLEAEDVSPIDPENLFSFGAEKFNELINKKEGQKASFASSGEIEQTTQETLSPEMVEISALMFVQIFEVIVSGACSWWSGVSGNYDFEKKMKSKYEEITAMYFKVQNIRLTPTHFFALMTGVLVFSSGFKAFKDRKRRLTAESFAKKSSGINDKRKAGEQATFFEAEKIEQERLYFAAETDKESGEAYYTKNPTSGTYAKKDERVLVEPELKTFLFDFKARNGNWPNRKQVKAFLNS